MEDIRYLGRGKDAIVRLGSVLLPPSDEFNTHLRRAAIFIYGIGLDDFGDEVVRGVVLDNPTPFTMAEMSPGTVVGPLGSNLLWRGGGTGGEAAMLLHSCGEIVGGSPIGDSGIHEGQLQEAMDSCDEGETSVDQYKFFFNYCQFSPAELEDMMDQEYEDGDAWMSVEVPAAKDRLRIAFRCWKFLRKAIRLRGFGTEEGEAGARDGIAAEEEEDNTEGPYGP